MGRDSSVASGGLVISEAGLDELNYYAYSGTDRSWLAYYVMQSFWNWAITLMPLSIAPNVITLVGFVGMIVATALVASLCPTFTEPLPVYAIVIVVVLVFLYQTLDALDGKQARRTKNSTPLGQLFDHGCDAVSMCCFAMMGGAVVRQGVNNPFFLTFFFSSLIAFYLAQWEEYWTGVIDLAEVGVTEGQILGLLLYVVGAVFGTDMFLEQAFSWNGFSVTKGELVLSVFASAFIGTTFQNIYRVHKATRKDQKLTAVLQLLPVFSLTVAFLTWIKVSPANIIASHPISLLVAAGIFFPACVERMVVARLTKDPVPLIYTFTVPVFLGPLQAILIGNPVYDALLIQLCAIVAIASYLHFAAVVIHQITTYFDIKPFSINRPLQWPLKKRKAAADATNAASPAKNTRGRSKSPRSRSKKTDDEATAAAPRAKSRSRSARRRKTTAK